MALLKLATVWLGGCSGCHMSFLDLDEWLFELARHVELVYSPIADFKEFPEGVDVALVEGAVANEDNLRLVRRVRARSRILVSFGDCAVTGNVTSLRNPLGGALDVLRPVYGERVPDDQAAVPALLDRVQPVHEVVAVDFYLPGCPPPADRIRAVLQDLVAGKLPQLDQAQRRFG
jgi:NAD-reducing hydrogenase small subunit